MCGRYASTRSATDLATLFDAQDETDEDLAPDYNVAPTDPVPIVRLSARTPDPVLSVARWGLVPPWSTDPSVAARMINARAETVVTSRAYARSFAERRCLVPADGWYEWRREDGRKQPYFMTRTDGECLAFAGVWTLSPAYGGKTMTFSVLTLPASRALASVHDRMPLVLPPDQWREWLRGTDPAALLRPANAGYLDGIELRAVSTAVGDVRNDGPALIAPWTPSTNVDGSPPTLF